MYVWKGAFAPSFTKHHGGSLEDHIDVNSDSWSIDRSGDKNTLTMQFQIEAMNGTTQVYETEMQITDDEAQELDDQGVKDLIGQQLRLPLADRTWKPPKKD